MTEELYEAKVRELQDEVEDLQGKLRQAEWQLDGSNLGWAQPREVTDRPGLALPRLELEWTEEEKGWTLRCEYRLVRKVSGGATVVMPIAFWTSRGRYDVLPWKTKEYRDGIVWPLLYRPTLEGFFFDAAHLGGLPIYMLDPTGRAIRLTPEMKVAEMVGLQASDAGLHARRREG